MVQVDAMTGSVPVFVDVLEEVNFGCGQRQILKHQTDVLRTSQRMKAILELASSAKHHYVGWYSANNGLPCLHKN
jgi:hypothetical protein